MQQAAGCRRSTSPNRESGAGGDMHDGYHRVRCARTLQYASRWQTRVVSSLQSGGNSILRQALRTTTECDSVQHEWQSGDPEAKPCAPGYDKLLRNWGQSI